MKLGEIANILGSTLDSTASSERHALGYSIDSRTVRAGEIFFAIRGENYDGHRFVRDALERGAIGTVVSRDFALSNDDADNINLIQVADTLVALQSACGGGASQLARSRSGDNRKHGKDDHERDDCGGARPTGARHQDVRQFE